MNPWRWVDPRVQNVRLADVKAYFLARGWQLISDAHPTLLRFEAPANGMRGVFFQMVPASDQMPDFRLRITELITTMSEIEERHPVKVLEEMLAAGQADAMSEGNRPEPAARR